MPSLITHDTFGRDVYDQLFTFIGGSRDESDAFLLGNQGPDPLFYIVINPRFSPYVDLGNIMHDIKPAELISAFKASLLTLDEEERSVGRAYALGFLCHYQLDSTVHPLVYFQQYSLCSAGVPNLNEEHETEVHSVIESELDELVLFKKRGQTVASFKPASEILQASPFVLDVVSKMYVYVAITVYGKVIPQNLFSQAVRYFRLVQKAFHSPAGIKRTLIGRIECFAKDHSFFQSMSHRPVELTESIFENHEHDIWENPFTGAKSKASFWDLYSEALSAAKAKVQVFDQPSFSTAEAKKITSELNFSGKPTNAIVLKVEDSKVDTISSATTQPHNMPEN